MKDLKAITEGEDLPPPIPVYTTAEKESKSWSDITEVEEKIEKGGVEVTLDVPQAGPEPAETRRVEGYVDDSVKTRVVPPKGSSGGQPGEKEVKEMEERVARESALVGQMKALERVPARTPNATKPPQTIGPRIGLDSMEAYNRDVAMHTEEIRRIKKTLKEINRLIDEGSDLPDLGQQLIENGDELERQTGLRDKARRKISAMKLLALELEKKRK